MSVALQRRDSDRSVLRKLSAAAPERRQAEASHLAHDARNWLTVLQIYCDLLRVSGAEGSHGRTWIEELSSAVARGQGLVNSLLDSAQTCDPIESASTHTARAKSLDLGAVLQSRAPLYRQMAGAAIRVEIKTAPHTKPTAMREADMDRILMNLVRNGIDAMPCGGKLTIGLQSGDACHRDHVVLRVSDTGDGIPAELRAHIFESGFSTKAGACNLKPGRGYGLAIVRELTLAAGGSVRVRSRIGHGTCFALDLPVLSAVKTAGSHLGLPRTVAAVSRVQKMKPSRTVPPNNYGVPRKGTRVPC